MIWVVVVLSYLQYRQEITCRKPRPRRVLDASRPRLRRPQTRPSCVSPASDPHPARVCGRPQSRLPAGTISICCLWASGRRKHITSEFFGNIQPALSLSQSVHTCSYCSNRQTPKKIAFKGKKWENSLNIQEIESFHPCREIILL